MIQVYKRPITVSIGDNPGTYYCAGFSRKGTADSIALAEQMKEGSSSFTRGEVVGVTLDLPARIKQALLAGEAVKINGLGIFKPSLTVKKVQENPEDLKTSAISIKTLNFKPDTALLEQLNREATYEWISVEKANTEDATDNANGTPTDGTTGTEGDNTPSGTGGTGTGGNTNPPQTEFEE